MYYWREMNKGSDLQVKQGSARHKHACIGAAEVPALAATDPKGDDLVPAVGGRCGPGPGSSLTCRLELCSVRLVL